MLIDKQTILYPLFAMDARMHPENDPIYVQQFSHLEQSDTVMFDKATKVRKGSRPKLRYVKAVYKIVRVL